MSGAGRGTVERELKLGARPGFALPDLGGLLPDVAAEAEAPLDLDATYVDTADLQLVRNGVSLRHRTGEGAARWTLKLPSGGSGDALHRREIDVEGEDATTVPPELAELVTAWVRRSPLAPVIVIRSHRQRVRLRGAGGEDLAELDDDEVTVVEDGEVAATFREVEVELGPDGTEELLRQVGDALVEAGAGAPDPTSKVKRALGPRALIAPDLAVPEPGPDATVEEVVAATLRRSVARLLDHDHVVRLDDDVEGVHQVRVATRRLRSDLRTLAPVLAPGWADARREELRALAGRLGEVRDLDVLVERLAAGVGGLPDADRAAGARVVDAVAAARPPAVAALHGAMVGDAYLDLLDDLVDAALRPRTTTAGEEPAGPVLPALVRPAWRALQRAATAAGPDATDDQLHRVRILAKRARYASELAAPVVGAPAADLGAALAELQDRLGELHDAVTAEARLRALATTDLAVDDRFAAGLLAAGQRADAEAARAAWPAAWAACDRKALTRWLR